MKRIICSLTLKVIIVSLLVIGCAQTPVRVKPIAKTDNPADHVARLNADLKAAKQQEVDVLSPTWFAKAQASYKRAKEGLDKGSQLSEILNNAALGKAELQQAEKFADKSKYHLSQIVKSRKMARTAGAQSFAREYQALERGFLDLTAAVEEDNFSYTRRHKAKVNNGYRELELRAIDKAALDNVRHLLDILRGKDAHKAAPASFATAQAKLKEAETFIAANRYDKEGIREKAETARFYAERAQHLAVTAEALEEKSPEAVALWVESLLHQINTRLNEADRRNTPLDVQQEHIVNAIDFIQSSYNASLSQSKTYTGQIETLNKKLAELEGRTYRVKADKERLAAEKRFNELYNKVSSYFSSSEAEVYKKANKMVIRLKAMQFPVGQAAIMPENYGLLTKIQKAIRTFGEPDIIIEGHTDSTGSQIKNQLLSQNRAEAVRKYLIANNTLPPYKIKSQGHGSSRPLVSNETARGRAVNRRIDIIIQPKMNK